MCLHSGSDVCTVTARSGLWQEWIGTMDGLCGIVLSTSPATAIAAAHGSRQRVPHAPVDVGASLV